MTVGELKKIIADLPSKTELRLYNESDEAGRLANYFLTVDKVEHCNLNIGGKFGQYLVINGPDLCL